MSDRPECYCPDCTRRPWVGVIVSLFAVIVSGLIVVAVIAAALGA